MDGDGPGLNLSGQEPNALEADGLLERRPSLDMTDVFLHVAHLIGNLTQSVGHEDRMPQHDVRGRECPYQILTTGERLIDGGHGSAKKSLCLLERSLISAFGRK